MENLQFPSSRDSFQSGAENIMVYLSAQWPQDLSDSYMLVLHNGVEEQKSLDWYYITTKDGLKFPTPDQKNSLISLEIFKPSAQTSSPLRTAWDSSVPLLSPAENEQEQVRQSTASKPSGFLDYIPSKTNTSQDILLNLVRQGNISISFYLFALAIALMLGALHALTPGHGKTVVGAYLVGSRGTSLHAVALGTVVTLTHTGSVFLLGVITLVASRYILPTSIIPVLEILSGLLIISLGLYLFRQRFQQWNKTRKQQPSSKRSATVHSLKPRVQSTQTPLGIEKIERQRYEHTHLHDHGDGHVHSHDLPESITWGSLVALGISGGLIPCPDAIAILLVAVAINRIVLGLALIVSFSLGLAVVLVIIGLLMVNGRRLFDRVRARSTGSRRSCRWPAPW